MPVNMLEGLVNSEEWQKKGVEVLTLDNRLIYPLYGVWSPTSQEHLDLVDLFMKSIRSPHEIENTIDLGCGTGILGILAAQYDISGEIVGVDNYQNALESAKINAQIYGLGLRYKTINMDLTKYYHNKTLFQPRGEFSDRLEHKSVGELEEMQMYRKVASGLGIPPKYDLILCNPPWIPASRITEVNPLDNGVYDPEEKFLKSALNFARLHLRGDGRGRMLLVYSNLAEILGLQQPDRIEELCRHAGLMVEEIYQKPMSPSRKVYDPLMNYKSEAYVQMYEILLTEYGELVNLRPLKTQSDPFTRKYREVFMIDNNTAVK